MQFTEAKVFDVLRGSQRDEMFVREMQDKIQAILKLLAPKHYPRLRKITPSLTNGWYYFMTTLGNLQTLGEEYTGTLRLNSQGQVPSGMVSY